jgi:hypothetical protein
MGSKWTQLLGEEKIGEPFGKGHTGGYVAPIKSLSRHGRKYAPLGMRFPPWVSVINDAAARA